MLNENWVAPSLKKMENLPEINISGINTVQFYLDWFDSHKEIPRTIPPLYKDFRIRFSRSYGSDGKERVYEYTECIHYIDDLTGFFACHLIEGKKILVAEADYNDFDGTKVHAAVKTPSGIMNKYSEEWLKNEGVAVVYTILAVQAFILYHKPEVISQIMPPMKERRTETKKNGAKPEKPHKTIGATKTKRIYLDGTIPKERNYNYRAIQWQVRGHYRHYERNGKTKIIYVQPHLAKRGWKKQKSMTVDLKVADEKKEE